MGKFSYLILNFLTVFFPVALSFDKQVRFWKSWRSIFPGLCITGILFLTWDYIFVVNKVWSFNNNYVTGIYVFDLPIEEILFFITVPFACIFIYECLNHYIKEDILKNASPAISLILIVFSVTMLIVFYNKIYPFITFGLLLALIVYAQYIKKADFLGRFYLMFLVSLAPFYLINGILTSVPIVLYHENHVMNIRIGSVPLEDHFYSLALLLMNVLFFEHFRGKKGVS